MQIDTFNEIAQALRDNTWDLAEKWLESTEADLSRDDGSLVDEPLTLFSELPTLLGGIAKVVGDPSYLMDLGPGGRLYEVAQRFGRFRHETGSRADRLMGDFRALRQRLWVFCEQEAASDFKEFFELERRLNLAIDLMAGAAVEFYSRRSASELLETAGRDKLTGFMHVRAIHDRLEIELARSKRYRQPLFFLRADIDNFGAHNQAEGRLVGNQLLRSVATELGSQLRTSDEAGRFGSDEFAVIMPQTSVEEAKRAAERIRHQVRQIKRSDGRPVTLCIVGASFPNDAEDRASLVNATDLAMDEGRADGGDVIKF